MMTTKRIVAAMFSLIVCGFYPQAGAQDNAPALHPVLSKKPPREVLNKDLLALPERERQAWIHGAMAQMALTLAIFDEKSSKCVLFYFFEERDGLKESVKWMHKYPERSGTITLGALAKRVCPTD